MDLNTIKKKKKKIITYDILNERVGGSIHVSRITYENNKFLSKVLLYTDNIH